MPLSFFRKDFLNCQKPFLASDGEIFSRSDLIRFATALSKSSHFKTPTPYLRISADNSVRQIIAILAALIAEKSPVLGQNCHNLQAENADFFHFSQAEFVALKSKAITSLLSKPSQDMHVLFYTSATTGPGTLVEKSWEGLWVEAEALSRLFHVREESVLNLVPCYHIYGLLFGVLLPWMSDSTVAFNLSASKSTIVIAVPTLWNFLTLELQKGRMDFPRLMFSSGSRLSHKAVEAFFAISEKSGKSTITDVLGSTETGGIGWRSWTKNNVSDKNFKFFPGVEILKVDDNVYVKSPYITGKDGLCELADQLKMHTNDEFSYEGRKDRIFKYGGKRYALSEIEKNLSSLLKGHPVRCLFAEDKTPKGGKICCEVEVSGLDIHILRTQYVEKFLTPFPDKINFAAGEKSFYLHPKKLTNIK